MQKQENITLYKDDVNTDNHMTFKELYDDLQDEVDIYSELGTVDELLKQKVIIQISDLEGQILEGYVTNMIGYLEGGEVLLTANLRDVFFKLDEAKK